MITVVLQPFLCRGVNFDRGHFLDTKEPEPLHPSLERQLIEQRYIRQATPDEYDVFNVKRMSDVPQRHSFVTKKGSAIKSQAPPADPGAAPAPGKAKGKAKGKK